MAIDDRILEMREEILRIARWHGVGRLRIFGSAVRGEMTTGSDVDFLIEIDGPTTPWFPGGLVADLEALLGCRVDRCRRIVENHDRRFQHDAARNRKTLPLPTGK